MAALGSSGDSMIFRMKAWCNASALKFGELVGGRCLSRSALRSSRGWGVMKSTRGV